MSWFYSTENWDPEIYQVDDLFRQALLLFEAIVRFNTNAQKYGIKLLVDVDKLSLKQCRHITPFTTQKLVTLFWVINDLKH